MKGWLIYDSEGVARNEWFISKVINEAQKFGLSLDLKTVDGQRFSSLSGECDIALVRSINPSLRRYLRSRGIYTVNNFKTASVANDKYLTYLLAKKLNVDIMPTFPVTREDLASRDLDLPLVLKSRDGHGGSEVFLAKDTEGLNDAICRLDGKKIIAQKLCSEAGVDMRVYVLGGKPIAAVLRRSENDFRSNFSLGGGVSLSDVSSEQEEVIRRLHGYLGLDFVGVDFILHEGRWILNEIEDAVGTRMLYKCSETDAAAIYAEYAARAVSAQKNQKYIDKQKE